MAVKRFLGAAWASVHGPVDERKLAVWTLDLGFSGFVGAPTPRPIDWAAVRALRGEYPLSVDAVRLASVLEAERRIDAGLSAGRDGDRAASLNQVRAAVQSIARQGVDTVILEPGLVPILGDVAHVDLGDPAAGWSRSDAARVLFARRRSQLNAALDRACRSLYDLVQSCPGVTFALGPSRCVTGLGEPDALAAIFEDLDGGSAGSRLAYWHDTALAACRAAVLDEEQGDWLERFASRMRGLTVSDFAEGRLHQVPGSGPVDLPLVAGYLTRTLELPLVLELDPGVDPGELPGARACLDKFGL